MGNVHQHAAQHAALAASWIRSSMEIDLDKLTISSGLDASLAIEYASFGAKLVCALGLLGIFTSISNCHGMSSLYILLLKVAVSPRSMSIAPVVWGRRFGR